MGHGVDRNETADGTGTAVTPVQLTLFTAKGDLVVGQSNGAVDNLPVGANGTFLKANSAEALGVEWVDGDDVLQEIADDADAATFAAFLLLLNALTEEQAPALADEIAMYDASASAARKMQLQHALKVLNLLTEDTAPAPTADFALVYDASASGVKKVQLKNLSLLVPHGVQVSTSGTAINFANIPSGVKRITVALSNVSTNGTSAPRIHLGDSGGYETTNYNGRGVSIAGGSGASPGEFVPAGVAAGSLSGIMTLILVDPSTNTWVGSNVTAYDGSDCTAGAFTKSLSEELTQVRVTMANGTDTFDAGKISLHYEF